LAYLKLSAYAAWAAFLFALIPRSLSAYPVDMDKLPNQGRNSFGCIVCHISPAGEEINRFGRDYRDRDHEYDQALQLQDSDGDGFSNDAELRADPPSNPGDPNSYPWRLPDPWAWGASLFALVLVTSGAFGLVIRRSRHFP
jgi:hypothetical protein